VQNHSLQNFQFCSVKNYSFNSLRKLRFRAIESKAFDVPNAERLRTPKIHGIFERFLA